MDIPLITLIEKLRYTPIDGIHDVSIMVKSVMLVAEDTTHFESGILYIGKSPPEKIVFSGNATAFFCCEPRSVEYTAIFFDPQIDYLSLFNNVLQIFLRFQQYEHQINRIISERQGFQELITFCSQIMGNPAYLVDASYKVIAMDSSPILPKISAIWKTALETGYMPYEIVYNFIKSNELSEMRKHKDAIIVNSKFVNNLYINSNIRHNGDLIGQFFVVGYYKKITDGDLALANILREIIRYAMTLNNLHLPQKNYDYENFLIYMICDKMQNVTQIMRQLKEFDWDILGRYQVFRLIWTQSAKSFLENIFTSLERLKNCKSLIYDGGIVAVFRIDNNNTDDEIKLVNELKEIIAIHGGRAGLSDSFDGFYNLHLYYKQACKAIELGDGSDGSLSVYRNYVYSHIFSVVNSHESLDAICEKTVLRMIDYDKIHGTQYIETLEIFLKNERKFAPTAKELYIHKNTLHYRIERISEIFSINLDDNELRMRLMLSFEIMRFKNRASL